MAFQSHEDCRDETAWDHTTIDKRLVNWVCDHIPDLSRLDGACGAHLQSFLRQARWPRKLIKNGTVALIEYSGYLGTTSEWMTNRLEWVLCTRFFGVADTLWIERYIGRVLRTGRMENYNWKRSDTRALYMGRLNLTYSWPILRPKFKFPKIISDCIALSVVATITAGEFPPIRSAHFKHRHLIVMYGDDEGDLSFI